MNLSGKSQCNKVIIELLQNNINLFHAFDQVYIFGSIIMGYGEPEDIDLLLIYKEYNEKIVEDVAYICSYFEKKSRMAVDLTALSMSEMLDTAFIDKIGKYERLK